jgi:O-antigen ligase
MKVDTLFISFKLLALLVCALGLAILITPLNFLMLEIFILAALFIVYFLFKDITKVIIAWIISLLFVAFSKTPLGIDIPNLSPDRAIWFFLVIFYLFNVMTGKISLSNRTTELLMFLLCGIAIFSVIRTREVFTSRDLFDAYSLLFNAYIAPFSIFLIAKDFMTEEQKIRKLFIILSVILLYLSLTSIFEHFKMSSFVFPKDILNPRLGINFGRSRGPFLTSSVNGIVLGMLSVLNFYMAMNTRLPYRIFFIVNIFLSVVGVFFTYTRASWLGIVISFMFMVIINRRFRKYFGIFVLLGIVLLVPLHSKIVDTEKVVSRINSKDPIDDRINLYHTYLAMVKEKPIMGFGFANFDNYSQDYFSTIQGDMRIIPTIHDSFFGILVELGGLGLIVFLSILASIFWKSFILFRRFSEGEGALGKEIIVAFWGMGIVYFLNLFFIDMKFHQIQNVIFYMVAGIILGLHEKRVRYEEGRK